MFIFVHQKALWGGFSCRLDGQSMIDSHLGCEEVTGWGELWTPNDQRADWVKGHANSDTAVTESQCELMSVKFG